MKHAKAWIVALGLLAAATYGERFLVAAPQVVSDDEAADVKGGSCVYGLFIGANGCGGGPAGNACPVYNSMAGDSSGSPYYAHSEWCTNANTSCGYYVLTGCGTP